MITVNTNMPSKIAQRSLLKSTNSMNNALQRLSTGCRINTSKDDAAGLAISTNLEYKTSSYNVAKSNTQMGQSMLDTANGSLSNIKNMLQRMRDLAEQSANGTYGADERQAMQTEVDALTEEIYRIKNTTEFNGKKILGEEEQSYTAPTISMSDIDVENITQTEWNSKYKGQTIGISSAKELQKVAILTNDKSISSSGTTFVLTTDINLDELGDIDGNGSNWTAIGNDDEKSFNGNFDGNGYTISNLKINKPDKNVQGLFGKAKSSTIKNIKLTNSEINSKNFVGCLIGMAHNTNIENITLERCNINGAYNVGSLIGGTYDSFSYIKNCNVYDSTIGAYDDCGLIGINYSNSCLIENCYTNATISSTNGNIGGLLGFCYGNITINDCYVDGKISGKPNRGAIIGTFLYNMSTITATNCAYSENKTGQTKAVGNEPAPTSGITKSDVDNVTKDSDNNISFETNLQVGINSEESSIISVDTGFSLNDFKISLLSDFSARTSLDKLDSMIAKVTNKMTEIGAVQNRLESSMEFQDTQIKSLTASNSLIKDADIAEESSNYIRSQILQQTTASLLATANQSPSIALQLI